MIYFSSEYNAIYNTNNFSTMDNQEYLTIEEATQISNKRIDENAKSFAKKVLDMNQEKHLFYLQLFSLKRA